MPTRPRSDPVVATIQRPSALMSPSVTVAESSTNRSTIRSSCPGSPDGCGCCAAGDAIHRRASEAAIVETRLRRMRNSLKCANYKGVHYAAVALSSGVRIGVYEIVALVGAGGMGEVYRARDTRLNRD